MSWSGDGARRVRVAGWALAALALVGSTSNALAQEDASSEEQAVPSPPVPTPPGARVDPETGLAERLTDPASGPPPQPRAGVRAYVEGEQAPGAPFDLAVAARRLGQGDPVGAFEAIEGPLLHRAAPLDPALARSAAILVRRSVHPGYNPFLIPLGAVFTALGAGGLVASVLALVVDSFSFGGSSTVEPVPYVFAFTAAGLSLVGGVITLISSVFVNRGGEVGVYQERRRAVLMRLREDQR